MNGAFAVPLPGYEDQPVYGTWLAADPSTAAGAIQAHKIDMMIATAEAIKTPAGKMTPGQLMKALQNMIPQNGTNADHPASQTPANQ